MSAADGRAVASREALNREQALSEFVLSGLRRRDGISYARFAEVFDGTLAANLPEAATLIAAALLDDDGHRLRLTDEGLRFGDDITARLLHRTP
jgi:coproporphyrinogen III oxidase-like Fe-S oxidoreductase